MEAESPVAVQRRLAFIRSVMGAQAIALGVPRPVRAGAPEGGAWAGGGWWDQPRPVRRGWRARGHGASGAGASHGGDTPGFAAPAPEDLGMRTARLAALWGWGLPVPVEPASPWESAIEPYRWSALLRQGAAHGGADEHARRSGWSAAPRLPMSTTLLMVRSLQRQGQGAAQQLGAVGPDAAATATLKFADVTVDPLHPFVSGGGLSLFPKRAETWDVDVVPMLDGTQHAGLGEQKIEEEAAPGAGLALALGPSSEAPAIATRPAIAGVVGQQRKHVLTGGPSALVTRMVPPATPRHGQSGMDSFDEMHVPGFGAEMGQGAAVSAGSDPA